MYCLWFFGSRVVRVDRWSGSEYNCWPTLLAAEIHSTKVLHVMLQADVGDDVVCPWPRWENDVGLLECFVDSVLCPRFQVLTLLVQPQKQATIISIMFKPSILITLVANPSTGRIPQ